MRAEITRTETIRGGIDAGGAGKVRAQRRRGAVESHRPAWSMDDIAYDRIDRTGLAENELLFHLLASASFIEITSDTYTSNLIAFCRDDPEVVAWLGERWQTEEVQHGAALRRYVETVWPDFDWERAYRSFLVDYLPLCSSDLFAETRALEMVGRCVVETGTASFYRMVSEAAPEPVLARLAAHISADEVDHYKHFYRYFRRFAETERPSRSAVLRMLIARTCNVEAEDAACAFKHVHLAREPSTTSLSADYRSFRGKVRRMAKHHFRYDMAVKMLLKPLELAGGLSRLVLPPATAVTRLLLFH